MKNIFLFVFFVLFLINVNAQDNPRITSMDLDACELAHYMAPGWNLGNTLEAGNSADIFTDNGGVVAETTWQSTKTTQEIINLVKSKGFKSIRIPCAWIMGHISDKTSLTIDASWLARVKEIVDYCISANLYVVLNDHWDGGWLEYDGFTTETDVSAKKEQLRKLWTNIATAFRNYDERLIFAGLNEPGVGSASPEAIGTKLDDINLTARLLEYEQVFIDAVRATGGNNANRILIVQGTNVNASNIYKLYDVTKLTDSASRRIMVEFHHYDPYQFCGMTEDASWGNMWYYWYGHAPNRATTRTSNSTSAVEIQTSFNNLKSMFVDRGYPVIAGEVGANHRTLTSIQGTQAKHDESIQYWYNFSTEYSYEAGVIPFFWDTNNITRPNMTIFNRSILSINDENAYDGIFQGDALGRSAFNAIYPEPSVTSSISENIVMDNKKSYDVYDTYGRKVMNNVSSLSEVSLPKGIYIYKGKKVVINK